MISAVDAAQKLQATLSWDPLLQEITFTDAEHTVQCAVGQSLVFFDYRETVIADAPIFDKAGQPVLPYSLFNRIEHFFRKFSVSTSSPVPPPAAAPAPASSTSFCIGAILIDPGHGGKDGGATGSYTEDGKTVRVYEKNIALAVSLALYKKLRHTYPDKKILLTRSDDTYPTLEERVEMANGVPLQKNEAILYISIHANASLSNRASGFEVWYLPPEYRRNLIDKHAAPKEIQPILNIMLEEEFTTESILMAKSILDGLDAKIGKESRNRGLKEREYFVVRNAKMPSILIELGFVSNPEEAKRLNTPAYLQKCAEGIYNGLLSFITQFESL